MLVDIISDMHIEHYKNGFDWDALKNPGSDTIVMAGDTSNSVHNDLITVMHAARHYKHVFIVDGNHSYYDNPGKYTVEEYENWFDMALKFFHLDNVTFLNTKNIKLIGKTLFIGGMGWYDFKFMPYSREYQHKMWKNMSNDSKYINFHIYPDKLAVIHADNIAYQVKQAQDNDNIKEIYIATHTVPHMNGLLRFPNPDDDALGGAYGNSIILNKVRESDKNNKVKVWQFGHTHKQNDFTDDGIRFISNPRGYPYERMGDKLIQIDTSENIFSAFGEVE